MPRRKVGRKASKARSNSPLPESGGFEPATRQEPVNDSAPPEATESGHESDASSAVGTRPKKTKVVSDLTPEEEQTMVEWLEAHPIFYNKKLTSYKETAKKEVMWTEKAAEMGKPVSVLKTWYTSLRSRFGRLKKKRSGADDTEMTERDEWVVRHFAFLRPYIQEVQKRPTVSLKQKLAPAGTDIDVAEMVDDNQEQSHKTSITTTRSAQPVASSTPRPKTQKQISEAEDALLVSLEERGNQMMNLQQQVLDRIRPSADREREAFVDWIRSVIIELDHSLWRRCQQEMSTVMYRYIGENDLLKRQQSQEPPQYRQSFQPRQDSSQACATMWQPQPSQWPTQPTSGVSVWHSQDANWLAQKFPQQYPQQQQRSFTQLLPAQAGCTAPGTPPVPMVTWEGVSNRPMATQASPITQGDNSQTTSSSLHFSDLINDSDPNTEINQLQNAQQNDGQ